MLYFSFSCLYSSQNNGYIQSAEPLYNRQIYLQNPSDGNKPSEVQSNQSKVKAQKQLVEDLKVQWRLLWSERFDDKVKAEGVSVDDYESLFVEQGTVIHATKDFKPLNFKDILQHHQVENPERYIQPTVEVGGWNKFIKTELTGQRIKKSNVQPQNIKKTNKQKSKKGGRGWLHIT